MSLHLYRIAGGRFEPLPDGAWPAALPESGYLWVALSRDALDQHLHDLQAALQRWSNGRIVDLHASDLLNRQLPSHHETTSDYDLLVVRRLLDPPEPRGAGTAPADERPPTPAQARALLKRVETTPVGFAVFDRVLVSVHHAAGAVHEQTARRLAAVPPAAPADLRGAAQLPASPADLMLRMVNGIVDGYLELRRQLTRQLQPLQQQLLDPRSRYDDWSLLLDARNALHLLEDLAEDQRAAMAGWIEAIDEGPDAPDEAARRERELLRVRSQDVVEHIERVLTHVRRLEQGTETAVQIHFAALGHRTNEIMRTLTVLTAIFLPLNLITGFFGMNFDFLPLVHSASGVAVVIGLMAATAVGLVLLFRRKRYLRRDD